MPTTFRSHVVFLWVIIYVFYAFGGEVLGQAVFTDCDKSLVLDCVLEMASNRDGFGAYQCRCFIENDTSRKDSSKDEHVGFEFCIAEDFSRRLIRRDWRMIKFGSESSKFEPWCSEFTNNDKKRRFRENYEINQEIVKLRPDSIGLIMPTDVWSLTFADFGSVERGLATSLYWMEALQESKLLASQESDFMIRGEWSFGKGSFRVQVYFDKRKGNMPVLCRYVCPFTAEEKFAKNGKIVFNEIESSWEKLERGWVPVKIRNRRDELEAKGGGVRVSRSNVYEFAWKTNLAESDKLFETPKAEEAISSDTFFNSFH